MLNVQMPPLAPIRDVARVGIWRSRLALEHGDVSRALDDCLTVARAAPHWQTRGTLIEQLVGIALSRLAHEEILALVHERVLAPVQLAELQRKISALYPDRYPSIDMESERLVLLDTIQRVFTNSGPGGGHLAPLAAKSLAVTGHDDFPEDLTGPWLTALGMIHAGRDDTVAKVEQIFELQAKCAKLTPYERYTADRMGADRILDSLPKYRYALIHSLAPALDRAADLAFQGRGLHEATLTILALHRYRAEKGRYPVSLGELQRAGYLEVLPVDPYRNGSLVYHVTNDDFTLYSLSRNFQDNGGRPALDRKGRRQKWADGGAGPVVLPIAFS